jgi:hypothetical protein
MAPFPESAALTVCLGLGLFLVVESLFIIRHVGAWWHQPHGRADPKA